MLKELFDSPFANSQSAEQYALCDISNYIRRCCGDTYKTFHLSGREI